MDRLVSLSIGTTGAEGYMRTFQDVSELARNMVDTHEYVSVSARLADAPEEEDPGCDHEQLYYDEVTLLKVHRALLDAVAPYGHSEHCVRNLINSLQNAGILFRERPRPPAKDEDFEETLQLIETLP